MKLARQSILPKLGLNWHTPLAIVHGPLLFAGNNRAHIKTEQFIWHIEFFMGYMRQTTHMGILHHTLLETYQLYLGVGFPILADASTKLPHEENSLISFLRRKAGPHQITFQIRGVWYPPKVQENDRYIMDDLLTLGLKPEQLK